MLRLNKDEKHLIQSTTHGHGLIKPKELELFLSELSKPEQLATAVSLSSSIVLKIDKGENPEETSPALLYEVFKRIGDKPVSVDAEYWFFDSIVRSEYWACFSKLAAVRSIVSVSTQINQEDTRRGDFDVVVFSAFFRATSLQSLDLDWAVEEQMLATFLTELQLHRYRLKKLSLMTVTPEFEIDLSQLSSLMHFEMTVLRNSTLQMFDKVDLLMPEVAGEDGVPVLR